MSEYMSMPIGNGSYFIFLQRFHDELAEPEDSRPDRPKCVNNSPVDGLNRLALWVQQCCGSVTQRRPLQRWLE